MDLFEAKNVQPMLIGAEGDAFDDPGYLFELKLDGERCLAYLDPREGTELRNKRRERMLPKVPELTNIHKQVNKRCILDGELIVMMDGVPSFAEIQRRSLMSNRFKIELAAAQYPACLTVYDILYYDGKKTTGLALNERKALLEKALREENGQLAVSRVVEGQGKALYRLAEQKDLEGVVAKRKDSLYYPGIRTKDWIKIKNLKDDDFVICGYILKAEYVTSLVLGQYRGAELIYKGHVTLGLSRDDFTAVSAQPRLSQAPFREYPLGGGNDQAIWLEPQLVCTVKYMEKNAAGGMRHPIFKGLRFDKQASECVERP